MKHVKNVVAIALLASLAACGGGGGNPGSTGGTGTGGTGNPTDQTPGGDTSSSVASFDTQIDKFVLLNSGSDRSKLTVTALDQNNNPVSGAAVKVVLDSGIYTPDSSTTDAKGQATGSIEIGGNKNNRNIVATITVNGKTKKETIAVTGSQVSFTATPAAPKQGEPVTVNVSVADTNNVGIPNATVELGGTLGFTGSVQTGANGRATATLAAAPAPGKYTVAITSAGVTDKRDIQVLDASGTGGVPAAAGTISAAALAITPNTIRPNTAGSTANQATLRAIFQDGSNRAIENVRVRFEIVAPGLGANESIATGSATVYTDVNGVASSSYIAGTRTSPTNGVSIRMCYGMTDAEIAGNACPNFKVETMTVAAGPVGITLGDNNKLERGSFELTYIKKFVVMVADSAGNAVPNAPISASVDLKKYMKGPYAGPRTTCDNEDTNRNGLLDVGEDRDGDGKLTPRKADVLISYVGSPTTGANGMATIQVEYPQNVATWLRYAVKVTTNVSGSEGMVEKEYETSFIEGDDKNGSFLTPPYGENGCTVAN